MSRTLFSLAGFQVITDGRFWVIAEAWIPKSQLIKDAGDPANNKFTKNDVSDVQTEVIGNIGIARFKEGYDAMIEGTHRARTIICSTIAEYRYGYWKGLSNHCSKVE
jgi:hypothetical protein